MQTQNKHERMSSGDYQRFENKRWDGRIQQIVFRHKAALELLKTVSAQTYLDIGCGDGIFERYVHRVVPTMKGSGIDLSPVAIDAAKKAMPGGSFIAADVLSQGVPSEENVYDAVIALDVLEHTLVPEALVREMKRVSSRYVIIGVPNFSSLPARIQTALGKVPENNRPKKGHVYWFNLEVLMKLIKENGLKICAVRANHQLERVPIVSMIFRFLTKLFPNIFALSFVVLTEKETTTS